MFMECVNKKDGFHPFFYAFSLSPGGGAGRPLAIVMTSKVSEPDWPLNQNRFATRNFFYALSAFSS